MKRVAIYTDGKLTPRDAAVKFADSLERRVGLMNSSSGSLCFQFVGGVKWFEARVSTNCIEILEVEQ